MASSGSLVFAYLAESAIAINLAYLTLDATRYLTVIRRRVWERLVKARDELGDREELIDGIPSALISQKKLVELIDAYETVDLVKIKELKEDAKYSPEIRKIRIACIWLFRSRKILGHEHSIATLLCGFLLLFSIFYLVGASYLDAFSASEWFYEREWPRWTFGIGTSLGILIPVILVISGRRFVGRCINDAVSAIDSYVLSNPRKSVEKNISRAKRDSRRPSQGKPKS